MSTATTTVAQAGQTCPSILSFLNNDSANQKIPQHPTFTKSRTHNEDFINRLSESLQFLTSRTKPGRFPEPPVPIYDNGNVTIPDSASITMLHHPQRIFKQFHEDQAVLNSISTYSRSHETRSQASHSVSVDTDRLDQFPLARSLPKAHVIRFSPKARPISTLSISTIRVKTEALRPHTSSSHSKAKSRLNKTTSYEEQRCPPPREIETIVVPRASSRRSLSRRRFNLLPSLKDLNSKSEKRAEKPRNVVPTTRIGGNNGAHASNSMITLKEALVHVPPPSPLHNAIEDRKFTQECTEMLSLKPKSKQQGMCQAEILSSDNSINLPRLQQHQCSNTMKKQEHQVSDTASEVSSIFDWDWPRHAANFQSVNETANQHDRPRPDSGLENPIKPEDLMTTTRSQVGCNRYSLNQHNSAEVCAWSQLQYVSPSISPPPNRPLPSLPRREPDATKSLQARRVIPRTEHGLRERGQKVLVRNQYYESNRFNSGHFNVDTDVRVENNLLEGGLEVAHILLPSPLRTRLKNNSRNARVDSLKRKHLSTHSRGNNFISKGQAHSADEIEPVRRGSAPSKLQTSVAADNTGRLHTVTCRPHIDTNKTSPTTPTRTRHRRWAGSTNSVLRLNSSQSQNGLRLQTHDTLSSQASQQKAAHYQSLSFSLTTHNLDFTPGKDARPDVEPHADGMNSHLSQSTLNPEKSSPQLSSPSRCRSTSNASQASTSVTLNSFRRSVATDITMLSSPDIASVQVQSDLKLADPDLRNQILPSIHLADKVMVQLRPENEGPCPTIAKECRNDEDAAEQPMSVQETSQGEKLERQTESILLDAQFQIDRLNSELDRMTRVYRCMVHARQGLNPEGTKTKSYAELLDDDRRANSIARKRSRKVGGSMSSSHHIRVNSIKFGASHTQSSLCSNGKESDEGFANPNVSEPTTKTGTRSESTASLDNCGTCGSPSKYTDTQSRHDIEQRRRKSQRSEKSSAGTQAKFSLYPKTTKQANVTGRINTLPTNSTRSPTQSLKRSASSSKTANKTNSKRYSLMSTYASHIVAKFDPMPQTSISSTKSRTQPNRTREGAFEPPERKEVAQAHDHPVEPIDLAVDLKLNLNQILTSTSQMDLALENFIQTNDTSPI